jgi:hypothetical protein
LKYSISYFRIPFITYSCMTIEVCRHVMRAVRISSASIVSILNTQVSLLDFEVAFPVFLLFTFIFVSDDTLLQIFILITPFTWWKIVIVFPYPFYTQK